MMQRSPETTWVVGTAEARLPAISNIMPGMHVSKLPWTLSLTQLPSEIHHVTLLDIENSPVKMSPEF